MEEREHRQALAAFLHTRRARLTQAEVGLPARSRHRTPELRRVVDVLTPHPAFVIGRRWDILFRNQATDLVFCFDEPFPPHSLNVVWRSFQMQGHSLDLDWEVQARNLVAHFRADYARYPGDASFKELLHDLQHMSSLFREWWEQHDIRGVPNGPQPMMHPVLGLLEFDHVQASFSSNLRVKIYAASPSTASKLEQALSTSS